MTLSAYDDAVLRVVEAVPRGQVVTYGDVAGILGWGGPRRVGRTLAQWGSAVPWHRVVRADGRPAAGHELEATRRLRAERCPFRPDGERVDMTRARWSPGEAELSVLADWVGPDVDTGWTPEVDGR